MRVFGIFKLEGIQTEEQFKQLEIQDLVLENVQLLVPKTVEGYSFNLPVLSGNFDDAIRSYVTIMEAPEIPDLLEKGFVNSYSASFGDFTGVTMTDLYSCDEDTWEVTEYNVKIAMNMAEYIAK